jgi:opacity protein-like surface antigen
MFKQFAVAATLAFAAASSFAAPTAFYGGVDVGSTKIDDAGNNKTSVGAFVGYGFNPNVALELGYRQAGKYDLGGADLTFKETQLSVVGSFPLNSQFDIYGRFGHTFASSEVKYRNGEDSHGMDGAVYGIGVSATLAPNLSVRLEAQIPARDVRNVNVGIVYKF